MNIAIGKFGKSVKFNNKTWGATGGANEAPVFYESFAKLNPNDKFYLIGRNDFSRLPKKERERINPHNNIIDPWKHFDKKKHNPLTFLSEYMKENNIKLDCGVLYSGSVGRVNVPGIVKKKNGGYYNVIETYKNYAAPMITFLNESNLPYITISPDPRYVPLQADDLLNTEKISMTMFNEDRVVKKMKSFEEQDVFVEKMVKCKYTDIVSIYLMDFEYNNTIDFSQKTNKFVIFHNESKHGNDLNRGKILTEYLLDQFEDVEIYGKWDEKWSEKDSRFKVPLKFNELQEMLPSVKYTFMIPIMKNITSMKYWECLNFGIIPFMHPLYDGFNHLDCPDFIRIKDKQDLLNKVNFLENNPDEYEKLVVTLKNLLTPEHYNGKLVNKQVWEAINELNLTK